MKKLLLVGFTAVALASCQASSIPVAEGDYDPLKNTYSQDPRTKMCFAAIGYQKMTSGGQWSYGLSHTYVPCTPEVLALIPKK